MKQTAMDRAYRIADELIKDKLRDQAPDDFADIESMDEADILVVQGVHDYIQQVLDLAGTRFSLVSPSALSTAALRQDQVMFVNCGAKFDRRGLANITSFVEDGGFLFTTDWALKDVLEPAFPGYVEYNQRRTRDEVVRVEIHAEDDPFLRTLIGPEDDPQWWLEGSSYPICILNSDKVEVIISSKELGSLYGEPAVFITFPVGLGRVYHMISHFYLQRSETRTARHRKSAGSYLNEKAIKREEMRKYQRMGSDDLSLSDVESAYTSRSVLSQVLLEKKRQMRRMKDKQFANADDTRESE